MVKEEYGFWKFAREFAGNHPFVTGALVLFAGCNTIGSSCNVVDSISRRVSGVEYKPKTDRQVCLDVVKTNYEGCSRDERFKSARYISNSSDKCERLHTKGIEACMGGDYNGVNKK
mgnify:CR=1 FL=1|jgi:hypothetical protein